MVVDPQVALALHAQRHTPVLCKRGVHLMAINKCPRGLYQTNMVKKTDSSGNIDSLGNSRAWSTVQVEGHIDLSLIRLAGDSCLPSHGGFAQGRW
jgi:hypothetical protein